MGNRHDRRDRSSRPYSETLNLANVLAPVEGINRTLVGDLTLLRLSESIPRVPVLYEPSIVFVIQGRKRGYVGSKSFVYDAKSCLVLSAAIPFECVSEAPYNKPLISVWVRLRKSVILDLLANAPKCSMVFKQRPKAIETNTFDGELWDTLTRLLKAVRSQDDARVLGNQIVRELIYRVLKGTKGSGVRAMVDKNSNFAGVYKALQRIHDNFSQPLEVSDLANLSGMSVSVFHTHFKQVTLTSPIQYIKGVRMHKARALMLNSNNTASVVAGRVGYKSASQFGREFKRFFGAAPMKEVEKARRAVRGR